MRARTAQRELVAQTLASCTCARIESAPSSSTSPHLDLEIAAVRRPQRRLAECARLFAGWRRSARCHPRPSSCLSLFGVHASTSPAGAGSDRRRRLTLRPALPERLGSRIPQRRVEGVSQPRPYTVIPVCADRLRFGTDALPDVQVPGQTLCAAAL